MPSLRLIAPPLCLLLAVASATARAEELPVEAFCALARAVDDGVAA